MWSTGDRRAGKRIQPLRLLSSEYVVRLKMRIAQIAPLYESVPPKLYGGTERIVSYLTEELVRQKQNVTLFASGDSVTKARLVPITEQALRLQGSRIRDPLAHQCSAPRACTSRSRSVRHFALSS